MQKIVINKCFGGFSLSQEAYHHMNMDWDGHGFVYDLERNNPKLVATVEALGERANGRFADLKVVEIPDDVEYEIEEYDGVEWVAEAHRRWS
jgi:hypothetical protein